MMSEVLLGAGLLVALGYLPRATHPPSHARTVLKTLPLVGFALAALASGAPLWLIAGLALSACGDAFLSRDGERMFLAGLISFAAAHLVYLALFVPLMQGVEPIPVGVVVLVAILVMVTILPREGDLVWPARAYTVIISAMTIAAFALPDTLKLATLGAVLFLLSDLILATRMFRLTDGSRRANLASYALWILYIAGQALILVAFL